MKKILFAVLLVIITTDLTAQHQRELSPEGKKKLEELRFEAKNRMQGVWTGRAGADSVVVYLLQTHTRIEDLVQVDSITFLCGWHKIFHEGTLAENSIEFASTIYNEKTTFFSFYKRDNDTYPIVIKDLTRDRTLEGTFELNANSNTAVLKTHRQWACVVISDKNIPGQTFPQTITLTRISPFIDEMIITQAKNPN